VVAHVGEDLDVVGVVEAERQGEDDLTYLSERCLGVERLGDLLRCSEDVGRRKQTWAGWTRRRGLGLA
jgi:hypothetical protein